MTKRNSRPAVLHLRKLKGESGTNLPSLSKARLKELIEEAIMDAYGEEEQAGGGPRDRMAAGIMQSHSRLHHSYGFTLLRSRLRGMSNS